MSNQPPPSGDNPYSSPDQQRQAPPNYNPQNNEGDATGGVIPYKNPKALISYYTGIFSIFFFPLGIVAIVLGIMGLVARKKNPAIKGTIHAWVGIAFGTFGLFCGGAIVFSIIMAIVNGPG